jgi:hypothetical protein
MFEILHRKIDAEFDCDQIWLWPATGDRESGHVKEVLTSDPLARGWTQGRVGRMNSERTIIELNIRHYRGLLTTEADPAKRRTIATLLAEEEAKLANLNKKGTSGSRG